MSCSCFTGRCDTAGRCLRRVFVSQDAYNANFESREIADEDCESEARASIAADQLSARFAALLVFNDGLAAAVGGLSLAAGDARFVLPGPELLTVAERAVDVEIGEGGLMHAIDHNAAGEPASGLSDACGGTETSVWTGITRPNPRARG